MVDKILSKVVVIQALYAVCNNEINWDVVLVVDDLAGFGKTMITLPKDCLDKRKLMEFIKCLQEKKVPL